MLLIGNLVQRQIAIAQLTFDRLGYAGEKLLAPARSKQLVAELSARLEITNSERGDLDRADMLVGQFLKIVDDRTQQVREISGSRRPGR